ncbi:hypothetical protein B0187_00975 [Haemophilus paracuniculus]|uniref:Uncharacterized protein n=1 Tax=Haemophilus paracuniculus TaxID=734 RepID=A0A1T0AVC6_9PAST|nr:hypothetical protein [Haemophilus paracuniculus]OOS00897.1 hypothetical protein B0187_00975 [Haemophilus paracuniculus]
MLTTIILAVLTYLAVFIFAAIVTAFMALFINCATDEKLRNAMLIIRAELFACLKMSFYTPIFFYEEFKNLKKETE